MERDFMGLNSKEPIASVKREIIDEAPEAHWPYLRNAASHPNFMSFRTGASQDDGMKKMNPPLPLSTPFLKPHFTSYSQNVSQQFLGLPMMVTSPAGPVVGFSDPWNNKKSPAAPAQMTIFYGGNVSVYDAISPEKAQAIMLLAGKGASLTSNMTSSRPPMTSPVTKVSQTMTDAVASHRPLGLHPGPGLANQLSLSSHPTMQSCSVSVCKDDQVVTKTTGISSSPVSKPEPQRVFTSRGPIPTSVMTPSAVPQFRKASLARFLEKRKERVVSVAPYTCDKSQDTSRNKNMVSVSSSAANSMTSP